MLSAQLELRFPPPPVESLPTADAIVLLGGVLSQPFPPRLTPNLGEAADRIIQAIRLYRSRKAPHILITGGNLQWQAASVPEARLISELLIELGIPASALVLENESRNTRENAVKTAAVFAARGWRTGLLVTSGTHMPRALATFRKVGLEVTPAATDLATSYPFFGSIFDFLPDVNALSQTTLCLKEFLGLLVYRSRDWV